MPALCAAERHGSHILALTFGDGRHALSGGCRCGLGGGRTEPLSPACYGILGYGIGARVHLQSRGRHGQVASASIRRIYSCAITAASAAMHRSPLVAPGAGAASRAAALPALARMHT